jgi:hypothetical protein
MYYYLYVMNNLKIGILLSVILTMTYMLIAVVPLIQLASAIGDQNTIDCNSKKGTTANTLVGPLNYGGVKCEGQNGGTAFAGGVGSGSSSVGIHGIHGPNGNAHFAGNIR